MIDQETDLIYFSIEANPPVTWYLTENKNMVDSGLEDWEQIFGIHINGTIFVPAVISLDKSSDFNIRACLYLESQPYIMDEDQHIYVPIEYARRKTRLLIHEHSRVLNQMFDCIETLANNLTGKDIDPPINKAMYH